MRGRVVRRLRDWAGAAVTIGTATVEHWLGETVAVAALTAVVVIFGGIVWRRVSMLMAAPRANNCTKAYDVENRLVNYMTIMAPLAPIVNANEFSTTNAAFLAALSKLPSQTDSNSNLSTSTPGGANAAWYSDVASCLNGVVDALNNLQSNLKSKDFEA